MPKTGAMVATLFLGLMAGAPCWAGDELVGQEVPPAPTAEQIEQAVPALGNPLNKPVTGAAETPRVTGSDHPPSLEALQASRPGDQTGDGLDAGRAEVLHQAALTYGAQGGLAARAFALNDMLRRYEADLDRTFDFHGLVLPVGPGQTLMRPPIVTEAQMAFALSDNAQTSRETACIYQITREAQLASTPPNWRSYLVRVWGAPMRPNDAALPRTDQEAAFWNKWVAEGWASGEKQAVEIFLADIGRLQRDFLGMARYRVLLRAGLVEQPKLVFLHRPVEGGRDALHVDDHTVRITDQPGLQPDRKRWEAGSPCM